MLFFRITDVTGVGITDVTCFMAFLGSPLVGVMTPPSLPRVRLNITQGFPSIFLKPWWGVHGGGASCRNGGKAASCPPGKGPGQR